MIYPFEQPTRDERIQQAIRAAIFSGETTADTALDVGFGAWVSDAKPDWQWYTHVRMLREVLEDVAEGRRKRVMIWLPPRHGKTELVSRLFTAYYLRRHPSRHVGLVSYGSQLAYRLSRHSRTNFSRTGGQLASDKAEVKEWETNDGGGLWASGIGGAITGSGFHLGIIDDPLKNQEEAQSQKIRQRNSDWWDTVWTTRQEPGAAMVVIQTRWVERDLSGRLLAEEAESEEGWHIVWMPALYDPDLREKVEAEIPASCTLAPDFREEPGQPLCPERYDRDALLSQKATMRDHWWMALYQGWPIPRTGGMFDRGNMVSPVPAPPPKAQLVRYWDKAATEGGGDYTVGVLMARHEGTYYVVDVVRGQWSTGQRENTIRQVAEADREKYGAGRVKIWVEQEGGASGKDSAEYTMKTTLEGFPARSDKVTGEKTVRWEPFAAAVENGFVKYVKGPWNEAFLRELNRAGDAAAYVDQVDAAAGGFMKLSKGRTPLTF